MPAFVRRIYGNRWNDQELEAVRKVWYVLVKDFFQHYIRQDSTVLDLGAGYCHFANSVSARRVIAMDANPDTQLCAGKDIEVIISDDLRLPMFDKESLTHVFISNFLEHLPNAEAVLELLKVLRDKIEPGGSILVLQPNFRYTNSRYFDFIDHHVILTDKSLIEALEVSGFSVSYVKKRFLPYTTKSCLPKSPWLVRLYLKLPILWHVFGQQTFIIAEPAIHSK